MKFHHILLSIVLLEGAIINAEVIDVTKFGVKNDGSGDCTAALDAVVHELKTRKGGELYFPSGEYRITTPRRAALMLDRISNVTIRFAPGAVLLMDNLQKGGKGSGHGITVRGPASNIRFENVHVKWAVKASSRSSGDAFRFEGFPDENQTLSRIYLLNCTGENSPQTGAVFMGCSDIFVNNFSPVNTWADGLHFNACRRVNVNGVRGIGNGDDTLAFVTYYAEKFTGKTGTVFSFPSLNEWCNSDSNAVNITSHCGHANGLRISGGLDINVSNIAVSGKWAGIQFDAARATTESRAVGWGYLASRGINISDVSIRNCDMGLIVRSLNILPDAPPENWEFALNICNLNVRRIKKLGIDIQSVAGVSLCNVRSDSRIRLQNLRGRIALANLSLTGAPLELRGIQSREFFGYEHNMEPKLIKVSSPAELASGNLYLTGLDLHNAPLLIDRITGLTLSDSRSDSAITIHTSRGVELRGFQTQKDPTVSNSETIQFNGVLLK